MKNQTKNKISLVVLVLLFISPVIIAILLNSNALNYKPSNYKNKGNLIQPPVQISNDIDLKNFDDVWTVVYQHSGLCDNDCLKMFETLFRIRLTKGHHMKKVKLLVLHQNSNPMIIPEQYNSIEKLSYDKNSKIDKTLSKLSQSSLGDDKGLYLLTPEGFLMMSYVKDFKPDFVIDDLGLLLRARKDQ